MDAESISHNLQIRGFFLAFVHMQMLTKERDKVIGVRTHGGREKTDFLSALTPKSTSLEIPFWAQK